MRALESGLFAGTLVVVPVLAWLAGRMMGRRNWRIGVVVAVGMLVAMVPHLLRIGLLAAIEGAGTWSDLQAQIRRTLDNPEVGLFFVAFGVFMTMLAWTATPVAAGETAPIPPAKAH